MASTKTVLAGLGVLMSELEDLYRDIHRHPELSMQEQRTAGVAATRLGDAGHDVTSGAGATGVVGVIRNGAVMRLHAIVSREVAATDAAAVTVGALQSGTKDNVIADDALLRINVRNIRQRQAGRVAEDIPTNHSPRFAPVIHPTLETGIQAVTAAALDALYGTTT